MLLMQHFIIPKFEHAQISNYAWKTAFADFPCYEGINNRRKE